MKHNITKENIEKLKSLKTQKLLNGDLIQKNYEKVRNTNLSK